MGIFIERRGYTRVAELAKALVDDLLANGFEAKWPTTYQPGTSKSVILEPKDTVNPLATTQQWAIKLQWDTDLAGTAQPETTKGGVLDMVVATPLQFDYTSGKAASYNRWPANSNGNQNGTPIDVIGAIGTACGRYTTATTGVDQGFPERTFIDRTRLQISATADSTAAFPMSYVISISPRGVVIFVWEQATDQYANRFSWVAIQRPVDHQTGQVIVSGKAPVHCVYNLMYKQSQTPWVEGTENYNLRRFIVREQDIFVPYPQAPIVATGSPTSSAALQGVDATKNSIDYSAIINAVQQVSITEDNKYVVVMPNGLNTARHAYTHELDMIAYTSADVVSMGSEVPVSVYGEAQPRKYQAMHANGPNNTGMRLLILKDGGGVSPAPAGGGSGG